MAGSASYGIYANPIADQAITTVAAYNADDAGHVLAYRQVEIMGADHHYEIWQWAVLEPTRGAYAFEYVDRLTANTTAAIPVIINIAVIDADGAAHVPADLAALDWDAAALATAFDAFLAQLATHLHGHTLVILIVGNEVNTYFDAHPTLKGKFATFLGSAKTSAHTYFVGSLVTSSVSFPAAAHYSDYSAITAVCEIPAWTYYPINYTTFALVTPHTIGADFSTMITAGASFSMVIQETGCPSATSLGGSLSDQQTYMDELSFITGIYVGAGVNLHATITWRSDLSSAILDNLGLPAGNFRDFYGSLGLVTAARVNKPALTTAATWMGGTVPTFKPEWAAHTTMSLPGVQPQPVSR